MDLQSKLRILADAAKYDASCASSGTRKRDSLKSGGIGSTDGNGICHSYAPDGRCISLLKILLTNLCIYDCHYCINRISSNVARARFSVDEVVHLTLDLYKRNYIEGLFLSSGIIRDPDYTMEQLVEVARELRTTHEFRGYIHLKTICHRMVRTGASRARSRGAFLRPTIRGVLLVDPDATTKCNPARLNVDLMRSHMPKRYWRNLPEAAVIPQLVAEASTRTHDMLNKTPSATRKAKRTPTRPERVAPRIVDTDLDALRASVQQCRDCPLWRNATQAVFGAGLKRAKIVFVGEQPGDQEDLSGEPFVGPAGRMLDRALEDADIDRKLAYVTNAVKHFKFEPRGKRRIHKKPNEMEIAACNQWLQRELRVVKPDLVVALGATGARAVFGKATAIEKNRGHIIKAIEAAGVHMSDVLVTVHPSFLLRVPDADKHSAYERFVEDLKLARSYAAKH